jgi:hypothetical protein
MIIFVYRLYGAYPEIVVDIVLSDDNAAEVLGRTSAETINPDPIVADAHRATLPPTSDQVQIVPASGAQGWKRLRIATKWSNPNRCAAQVITQIELPPYRGPQNLLD